MFTNPAILSLFVPAITMIAGTLIGSMLTRKKHNAEVDSLELENLQKLIEIWQKMARDIKVEYEELKKENQNLIEQMHSIENKMDALKNENDKLLKALKEIKKQQGKTCEN